MKECSSILDKLRCLITAVTLLCGVVLTITGFFPSWFLGKTITGYWLMLHAIAGPVFAVCITVHVLMVAHNYCYNDNDWPWLMRLISLIGCKRKDNGPLTATKQLGSKTCFWLIAVLALGLNLSILSSMLPFVTSHTQEVLLHIHRYCGLALVIVALVYTNFAIIAKTKKTKQITP